MDIGTTAIKCVICDPTNRKSIISTAVSIQRVEDELLSSGRLARITHLPPSNKQRSVEAVLVTIQNAIRQIPSAYLQKVKRVGICGQVSSFY
jgi:sugar (pentulose or hexulose) kinase